MKLDNFFVSGANEEAVAMAEAVLNNVKAYSPVLIYAKPGRGKTHLLHEIQDKCKSALAGQKVAFTTGRSIISDKTGKRHGMNKRESFHLRYGKKMEGFLYRTRRQAL